MSVRRIAKEVVLWLFTLLLALLFIKAGVEKFDDAGGWSRAFRHFGFPVWFRIAIGAIEAAGAVLLLWPRTASYGAISLAVVMAGAIGTHIKAGDFNPVAPIALVLCAIVAIFRWRQRLTRTANPPSAVPAPPLFG
jgi:uncharacterized membrane protein YphA (DoxX/SURF4 family)